MKRTILLISILSFFFATLPSTSYSNSLVEDSCEPLINDNVNAFIKAQKLLGKEAIIKNYNDSVANIETRNSYGKRLVYEFDYINNRVISTSKSISSNKDVRKAVNLTGTTDPSTKSVYSYDSLGNLTKIKKNNDVINLTYNSKSNLLSESLNNQILTENTYNSNDLLIKSSTINGDTLEKSYNENNLINLVRENGVIVSEYKYDDKLLKSYSDLKTGITHTYRYSDTKKIIGETTSNGLSIDYTYDENEEQIHQRNYSLKNQCLTTNLNSNGLSTNYFKFLNDKDISDRTINERIITNNGFVYQGNIKYVIYEPKYDDLTEDNHDSKLENKTSDTKISTYKNNFFTVKYSYDECDNLRVENYTGLVSSKNYYEYNEDGSLSTFINEDLKETYDYDERGNISKINNKKLTYDYSSGFDLLTSFSNYKFAYDDKGNPITYKGNSLNWFSSNLVNYNNISFTYNQAGIRTSKKTPNDTILYFLEGDKVVYETSKKLNYPTLYFYNGNDIVGLKYENKPYFYIKNNFNDILGLFDEHGNVVVKYEYSPWGKILGIEGSLGTTLGIDNPYRFKSYRYDNETGLYYLGSRYYDPEIGRFISPDNLTNLQYTLLNDNYEKNLFMYSFNNPVNYYDPKGNMAVGILNVLKFLYSDLKLIPDYAISTPCLILNGASYTSLHECAQLVAAKQLSKSGYITQLEYKLSSGNEADILAYKGINYLYEVKPVTVSNATAYAQLSGYLKTSGFLAGPAFASSTIDFLPKIKMTVYYESKGIIKYIFYKDKKQWFNKTVMVQITEANLLSKIKIGYWVGVAVAGTIIAATIVEDVLTAGAGVADDAASVSIAAGGFRASVAFGLLFV